MNKHELKSLLENIYTALTEETAQPEYLYLQLMKGANPIRIPNPRYVRPAGRDWTVPYVTDDPDNPFGHEFQGRIDAIRHGNTFVPAPRYKQQENMTEADIPDHPPKPEGWDENSPDPWPWPPNKPPVVTPPPKPPTGLGVYPRPGWWTRDVGDWPPVNNPDDTWQTVPLPEGVQPPPGARGGSFVVRTVQRINEQGLLELIIEMFWIDKNGTMWHFNPNEGDHGTWEVIPPQGPPGLQPQQPDQPGELG